MTTTSKRSLFALPLILLGTLSFLYFGIFATNSVEFIIPVSIVGNEFVDEKLKYQIIISFFNTLRDVPHIWGCPNLGKLAISF